MAEALILDAEPLNASRARYVCHRPLKSSLYGRAQIVVNRIRVARERQKGRADRYTTPEAA
jgi:hypothetical protein